MTATPVEIATTGELKSEVEARLKALNERWQRSLALQSEQGQVAASLELKRTALIKAKAQNELDGGRKQFKNEQAEIAAFVERQTEIAAMLPIVQEQIQSELLTLRDSNNALIAAHVSELNESILAKRKEAVQALAAALNKFAVLLPAETAARMLNLTEPDGAAAAALFVRDHKPGTPLTVTLRDFLLRVESLKTEAHPAGLIDRTAELLNQI